MKKVKHYQTLDLKPGQLTEITKKIKAKYNMAFSVLNVSHSRGIVKIRLTNGLMTEVKLD